MQFPFLGRLALRHKVAHFFSRSRGPVLPVQAAALERHPLATQLARLVAEDVLPRDGSSRDLTASCGNEICDLANLSEFFRVIWQDEHFLDLADYAANELAFLQPC